MLLLYTFAGFLGGRYLRTPRYLASYGVRIIDPVVHPRAACIKKEQNKDTSQQKNTY
jgi:hypothetical protein